MDREFVKKFTEKYPEVRNLFEKHQELDRKVAELSEKRYLTPEEEVKLKEMKKEKLYIKEELYRLIKKYEGIEID